MLAGLAGMDRHHRVPEVRRPDGDRVDVLALQDLPIVGVEIRGLRGSAFLVGGDLLRHGVQPAAVHIAQRRDIGGHMALAHAADADARDHDPIVGAGASRLADHAFRDDRRKITHRSVSSLFLCHCAIARK